MARASTKILFKACNTTFGAHRVPRLMLVEASFSTHSRVVAVLYSIVRPTREQLGNLSPLISFFAVLMKYGTVLLLYRPRACS